MAIAMGPWLAIGWMAAAGLAFPAAAGEAEKRPATTHTVTMAGTRFEPAELKIKASDTVVWINDDIVSHTATDPGGSFDSGRMAPGKSWKYRPGQKGTFPYFCAIHPTMKGVLRVE